MSKIINDNYIVMIEASCIMNIRIFLLANSVFFHIFVDLFLCNFILADIQYTIYFQLDLYVSCINIICMSTTVPA